MELSIPIDNADAFNADTYEIVLRLGMTDSGGVCEPNILYENSGSMDHCKDGRTLMQTYANMGGPISDLTPE